MKRIINIVVAVITGVISYELINNKLWQHLFLSKKQRDVLKEWPLQN